MPEFTPEDIANRRFPSAFRGYAPEAVAEYLAALSEAVSALVAERDRLQARMGEMGERDLKREFEAVGREVAEVLEAAREAAGQMRERASADATRWRSEAVAEAEATLRRARADAEQLRSDAWSTSDELLKQAMAEADRIGAATEQERLRMVGEAEREAHRLVSSARREADELLRSAKMEGDRLLGDGQAEHDRIIQQANRSAEAAQERTRALEVRREELRSELDEIRHALATVEGELEDRRAALALSPITPDEPEPEPDEEDQGDAEWTPGETVRVVRPSTGPGGPHGEVVVPDGTPEITVLSAAELARRAAQDETADQEPEPGEPVDVFEPDVGEDIGEDVHESDVAGTELEEEAVTVDVSLDPVANEDEGELETAEAGPVEEIERLESIDIEHVEIVEPDATAPADEDEGDRSFAELSGLFDRLRAPEPEQTAEAAQTPVEPSEQDAAQAEHHQRPPVSYEGDAFELESGLLMPIANRALRNVKRQLTEAQNEALEELRLSDGAWDPDGPSLAARLRPDLTVLASESFAAGHAAAVEMSGERLKRPATPKSEPEREWVEALLRDLNQTLAEGRRQGQGSRELGASVSRVFRSWRTDEAERRVSEVSSHAYHTALFEVLIDAGYSVAWEVAGRGCPTCRTNAESVPSEWSSVPPAHTGCSCTLVII